MVYLAGQALAAAAPARVQFATFTDAMRTGSQRLAQTSPWLQLWDVETPSGTLRLVAFADPDARGVAKPYQVTFDGNEYAPIEIARSEIQEAPDGQPRVSVVVHDPLRVIDRRADLDGYAVTLWITRYDLLADGSSVAKRYDLRIQSTTASAEPDLVTIVLGLPSLFNQRHPRLVFSRRQCLSDWNLRRAFLTNKCTAYSDEFEAMTAQDFHADDASETPMRNGWHVVNGNQTTGSPAVPRAHSSGVAAPNGSDLALHLEQSGSIQWLNGSSGGVFVFRRNGDELAHDLDFDVAAKLSIDSAATTKDEYMAGLLIQSYSDLSDWLFWGLALESTPSPASVYRMRKTVTGSSTSTDYAAGGTPDSEFRMRKVGDAFTLYTRAKSTLVRTDNDGDWTQRATTTLSVGSPYRLGLVVASDFVDSDVVHAYFHHFRVLDGFGLQTCDRSIADCLARGNDAQFNGFRGMPDGSVFVR